MICTRKCRNLFFFEHRNINLHKPNKPVSTSEVTSQIDLKKCLVQRLLYRAFFLLKFQHAGRVQAVLLQFKTGPSYSGMMTQFNHKQLILKQ